MTFLKDKGLKFLDLEQQYKGKRLIDLIFYSKRQTLNKHDCLLRVSGLENELHELEIYKDAQGYIQKELLPHLLDKSYWKQDAGNFVYSFYDYFVLGYGDFGRSIMSDEEMFSIMNYTIYYIVSLMHINNDIEYFLSRIHKPFIFF